jgi:hypothetical protein
MKSVYSAVRTGALNKAVSRFVFKGLNFKSAMMFVFNTAKTFSSLHENNFHKYDRNNFPACIYGNTFRKIPFLDRLFYFFPQFKSLHTLPVYPSAHSFPT